jgi:hypothetical protein
MMPGSTNHVPQYYDSELSESPFSAGSWSEREEFARRLRPNRRLAFSEAVQSSIDRVGINFETLSFLRFNRRSTEPIEFDREQLETIALDNESLVEFNHVLGDYIHIPDTAAYLNYERRIVDDSVEQTEQEFHDSLLLGDLFELVIDIDFVTFSNLRMGMEVQEGYYGRFLLGEDADFIMEMRDGREHSYEDDWDSDMEEGGEEEEEQELNLPPTIPVVPVGEGKDACYVCCVNVPSVHFKVCGHSGICPVCAHRIACTTQKCPLCRADAPDYVYTPSL